MADDGIGAKSIPQIPTDVAVSDLRKQLAAAIGRIITLEKNAMPTPPKGKQQLSYAQTLTIAGTVGSTATLEQLSPLKGFVKEVMISWPAGCIGLVDVAVFHTKTQFCPNTGFLALDNFSPIFAFNEFVRLNEPIRVVLQNRDGLATHRITVTVTIEEG